MMAGKTEWYHVTGQVQCKLSGATMCPHCGQEMDENKITKLAVERNVEAESPGWAIKIAGTQVAEGWLERMKDDVIQTDDDTFRFSWDWSKPPVAKEMPTDQVMRMLGAPTLFDDAGL